MCLTCAKKDNDNLSMLYIYTQALLGLSTALMPLHNGVWFGLCKQTTYQLVNALTSLARVTARLNYACARTLLAKTVLRERS